MKIPLIGGFSETRMVAASPQSLVNLYAEPNPQDSPFPVTLYNTPGLTEIADFSSFGPFVRGLYVTSTGGLYGVIGQTLFQVNVPAWTATVVGNLGSNNGQLVSMVDNGITLVVVDGSANGWTVNLSNNAFAAINNAAFYGATRVDFVDTFFVFNRPNTPTFYTSLSNSINFDPTYWAEKIGYNDKLMSVACPHDTIWLIGEVTSEVWFNSGGTAFPFQRMPNSVIQYGCAAQRSVIVADNAVFWLSQDRWGRCQLMRGQGFDAKRVSNFAVEERWMTYPYLNDCWSMSYAEGGHQFIVLTFPNANPQVPGGETWVLDVTTGFWHQRMTGNPLNNSQRYWLPTCMVYFNQYGATSFIVAGDSESGRLFLVERVWTDNGTPIYRERTFPHILNDQKRVTHQQFVASMMTAPPGLNPDQVSLRWSDDGGQTWGAQVVQTVNGASNGQYSWRRLGLARDRVYQLSWTAQGETALNGAWVEATSSAT